MDYYDLIKYLAERSWFENLLTWTPITSTIEFFFDIGY